MRRAAQLIVLYDARELVVALDWEHAEEVASQSEWDDVGCWIVDGRSLGEFCQVLGLDLRAKPSSVFSVWIERDGFTRVRGGHVEAEVVDGVLHYSVWEGGEVFEYSYCGRFMVYWMGEEVGDG